MNSSKKALMMLVAFVLCLPFLAWSGVRIYSDITFEINIEGRLKRAADANTVELAKSELDAALVEIERSKMTEGYTSILYKTPDEDVGFWYKNLSSARDELGKVTATTTQLERSNLLLKLRQTLLDHGSKGSETVTVPPGITVFPSNTAYLLWGALGMIMLIVGVVMFLVAWND